MFGRELVHRSRLLEMTHCFLEKVEILRIGNTVMEIPVDNLSVLVDNEHRPLVVRGRTIKAPVLLCNVMVVVTEKPEGKVLIFCPFVMRPRIVTAHREHFGAKALECGEIVAERADFLRAAGTPVGGIECENDVPAANLMGQGQRRPRHGVSGGVWKREVGSGISNRRCLRLHSDGQQNRT